MEMHQRMHPRMFLRTDPTAPGPTERATNFRTHRCSIHPTPTIVEDTVTKRLIVNIGLEYDDDDDELVGVSTRL